MWYYMWIDFVILVILYTVMPARVLNLIGSSTWNGIRI